MTWPSPSDYQDAIQNARTCFQDPDLKAGNVAITHLGLPRVMSGNFASVYELRNGGQHWAVRCFLRQVSDQQRRYSLLSQHLSGLWLPSLVKFHYLSQGIRVRGQWYPVVRMDWTAGDALHIFIERNGGSEAVLLNLAAQWRGLVNSLRGNGIAHGDLQHGNVLVSPKGHMQLVDYDAMFVPLLRGGKSPELGHENFQHPKRTPNDYDEKLDNFAGLVIYTSLRALAVEPHLWQQFHTGENLIFSSKDYKAPQHSPVFLRLKGSSDSAVRTLAIQLEKCCLGSTTQIPEFEALVASLPMGPLAVNASFSTPIFGSNAPTSPKSAIPTWKPTIAKAQARSPQPTTAKPQPRRTATSVQPTPSPIPGPIPTNAQPIGPWVKVLLIRPLLIGILGWFVLGTSGCLTGFVTRYRPANTISGASAFYFDYGLWKLGFWLGVVIGLLLALSKLAGRGRWLVGATAALCAFMGFNAIPSISSSGIGTTLDTGTNSSSSNTSSRPTSPTTIVAPTQPELPPVVSAPQPSIDEKSKESREVQSVTPTPQGQSGPSPQQLIAMHTKRAEQLFLQEQFDAALAETDEGLRLDPNDGSLRNLKDRLERAKRVLSRGSTMPSSSIPKQPNQNDKDNSAQQKSAGSSEVTRAAVIISIPAPVYPQSALSAHISGTVFVEVIVDETGSVSSARVVKGPSELHQAAVSAARQSRFRPAMRDGRPVTERKLLPIMFNPQF